MIKADKFAFLIFIALAHVSIWAQEVLVAVEEAPADGLVVAHADLTASVRWCKKTPVVPQTLRAIDSASGQAVPIQFVPDADFNPEERIVGTMILQLPKPGPARLKLDFGARPQPSAQPVSSNDWNGAVTTVACVLEHDAKHQGGLPWRVTFRANGRTFDSIRWNNRLYHRQQGGFCVCDDPQPQIQRIASGPICTVVRVKNRFVQAGKWPASRPDAIYDWFYFSNRPLVYVTASIHQAQPSLWHETHFLELNYPGAKMPQWAGGEPLASGRFQGTFKSFPQAQWGVIHDGTNGVGMVACGQALLHDGGSGAYLQAHGDSVWKEWEGTDRTFSSWLWMGSGPDPAAVVRELAKSYSGTGRLSVFVDAIEARVDSARSRLAKAPAAERQRVWWQVQGARQLAAQGRLEDALRAADGHKPSAWTTLEAGDLGLILERAPDGIRLVSLFDSARDVQLVSAKPLPLFGLTLRHSEKPELITLPADVGWKEVEILEETEASAPGRPRSLALRWQKPGDGRFGDLRVVARLTAEPGTSSLQWKLTAENQPQPWSVWRVVFPQVAVANLGPQSAVLFPKAAGEVQRGVWTRGFKFAGTYPSGWTSMQFMAAYEEALGTGLYLGVHDPWGSTKDLLVESRPSQDAVVFSFDHPVPGMGVAANRFELSGQAVWRLLRGDWFDASVVYRDWVRKEAKWYPKLGAKGREDTPLWMRELSVWALGSGPRSQCVPEVQAFTRFLGPPTAVHWYNWHQIPFDNDYPHYFPTAPGFAEGVRDLQTSGTSVMPYINGRLWDTRDRGTNDFEFTSLARPAVTKDEKGEPYIESYGSKEANGTPVRLGVMCPATELWQARVREIVLRLMNECGVQGVYIDQIAAAQPTLCFDKAHGHPLGGGHWWTEGYWHLLESIRKAMPEGRMLTTECNGEPYIRCFDGYLTWHWQYDGQVPAFSAVYGGAIQMFGRSYGGGSTRDLALRMRAGQQLVFGEQLGWLAPGVVKEKENAEFFRQATQLRRRLAEFFYAGEMARPPKLAGKIPTVRADWQWNGVDWVTTDAVLTGAWHQPSAKKLVLIFVNVSQEPVAARVDYDARACGFSGPSLRLTKVTPEGVGESFNTSPEIHRETTFPPRTAWAWEVSQMGE